MLSTQKETSLSTLESHDSLDSQQFHDNTVLSSTTNADVDTSHAISKTGRLTMLPTISQHVSEFETNLSSTETQLIQSDEIKSTVEKHDEPHVTDHSPQSNLARRFERLRINDSNESEKHSHNDQQVAQDAFDVFILKNFTQYSGKEDVLQWLDDTEEKFKQFDIGRHARFEAISFLVAGDAKRKYIRCRASIRSFDDFYAFLLSEFDSSSTLSYPSKNTRVRFMGNNLPSNLGHSSVSSAQVTCNNDTKSDSYEQLFHTDANPTDHRGAATSYQGKPILTSTTLSHASSTFELDQTLNDLRKAIVSDFIKSPKVFKGGKDDVTKWIEDVEHLFNIAHLPEAIRLDLISYSLRGEALDWFKNNRSSFLSWSVFVTELKRAFTSSFHEELAFKKLESYSQGESQSIRSFVNEVLKLCKEADSTMSEATKLKNLLNKAKPSIQYEVRKKKPKSTSEFLEYAKEAEELMQLSNMTFSSDLTVPSDPSLQPQMNPISQSTTSYPAPMYSGSQYNPSYTNSRNFNNRNQSSNNRNFSSQPRTFPNSLVPSSQDRSNVNTTVPKQPHPRSSLDSNPTTNRPNHPPSNRTTSTKPPYRPIMANVIDSSQYSDNTDSMSEPITSIYCTSCNQLGHEASACSSF